MPLRSPVGALPRSRPLRAGSTALLGALGATIFLGFSGCDLDWTTRLDPVTTVESGAPDRQSDGAPLAEASTIDEASTSDVTTPDASSCAALKADVDNKKKAARRCQFGGGGCVLATLKDICNCDVRVENPSDARASSFVNAVKAFNESGCDPKCGQCIVVGVSQCLSQADGDGGVEYVCVPSN